MATPDTKFLSGESQAIDYTPGSAVTAGDVVVVGSNVFFAKLDIAANALGALHIGGVWRIAKTGGTAGDSGSAGALIYWDDSGDVATTTASSHKKIGVAAAAFVATDTYIDVLSIPQAV